MARQAVVTDPFTYSNGLLTTVGTGWVTYTSDGSLQVASNEVQTTGVSTSRLNLNTAVLDNAQYVKATISGFVDSGIAVALIIRAGTGADDRNYYMAYIRAGAGNTNLYRVAAGALTSLGLVANPGWASGDTAILEADGTALTVYRNDSVIGLSATDATYASGRAGLRIDNSGGSALTDAEWDSFEAGNLVAGGGAGGGGLFVAGVTSANWFMRRFKH